MAASLPIKPEEVYLCVLCHYYVHPPTHSQRTGLALPACSAAPTLASAKIALFLLRLLKVTRNRFAAMRPTRSLAQPALRCGLALQTQREGGPPHTNRRCSGRRGTRPSRSSAACWWRNWAPTWVGSWWRSSR